MSTTWQIAPLSIANSVRSCVRWLWLPAFCGLMTASSAYAVAPQVKDGGGFFSASAIEKANQKITDIERRFHRDLEIETVQTVPKDKVDQVKTMDASERSKFFEAWARSRARGEAVNGIYILICRQPGHFTVLVGNKTQNRDFTLSDRKKLVDQLGTALGKKEFDSGLLEAVNFVEKAMAENIPEKKSNPAGVLDIPSTKKLLDKTPFGEGNLKHNAPVAVGGGGGGGGMHWIIWAVIIVFVIWIVFRILGGIAHALFGGGGGPPRRHARSNGWSGSCGIRIRPGSGRRGRRRIHERHARRLVRSCRRQLAL